MSTSNYITQQHTNSIQNDTNTTQNKSGEGLQSLIALFLVLGCPSGYVSVRAHCACVEDFRSCDNLWTAEGILTKLGKSMYYDEKINSIDLGLKR